MKTIFLRLLHRTGRLLHWKWLLFTTGILLLAGNQSCRNREVMCYVGAPTDTTNISQPADTNNTTPSGGNLNATDTSQFEIMCYKSSLPRKNDEDAP